MQMKAVIPRAAMRGAIILSFQAKRDNGKEPPPEVHEREGLSRVKVEAGDGVEEMHVEKGHENDDEPLHYLLRRV
jgi:hypothetical protein